MVRTEADVIVHHHINHHQGIIYKHPQCNEFFYEEKLRSLIYHYNDFEDDYGDEGIIRERRRRFANPNPNRRDRFLSPNRRDRFPNSIRDKGGEYSILDEFGIPFFMGVLMLSHPYFRLIKLISCLTWSIFSWRIMSSLCLINLKKKQRHGGINCKTSVWTKANHL